MRISCVDPPLAFALLAAQVHCRALVGRPALLHRQDGHTAAAVPARLFAGGCVGLGRLECLRQVEQVAFGAHAVGAPQFGLSLNGFKQAGGAGT